MPESSDRRRWRARRPPRCGGCRRPADRRSALRWWSLSGTWLAVAFSVAFGLYVDSGAQGLEVSFIDTLMAILPHYLFWVPVSPAIYRALHKTIGGPHRVLWTSMLAAWSAIALAGPTAMSFWLRHPPRSRTAIGSLSTLSPPAGGPAFWAMVPHPRVALAAFAAIRRHRLRLAAIWNAAQTELRGARLEAQLAEAPARAAGADQPTFPAEQPERNRQPGADRRARARIRCDRPTRRAAAHCDPQRPRPQRHVG